jgi:hypothetical protein
MMPINHPDRVGKTLAALSLLSDRNHRITVNGSYIKVSTGPSSVETFNTEEEFMVWVLEAINEAVNRELHWFKTKYPKE